jgi:Gpi18-like mannosyltransferase
MFRNKTFLLSLSFFLLLNSLFYAATAYFYQTVPLQTKIYHTQANHYFTDPRINDGNFNLLRAMGGWDAQWYLKIADAGYATRNGMDALSYAFFPFYPIVLMVFNGVFANLEVTAFILTNLFLIANFASLYYVISKLYSSSIALRANFLLFLFPFSAYFRYYYAEALFLFLLIWFSYFLIKRRWFVTTFLLSLLVITKPQGLVLVPVYLFYIWQAISHDKLPKWKGWSAMTIGSLPFLAWLRFCYLQTHDSMYWSTVQSVWYKPRSPIYLLFHNIQTVFSFFSLPFHSWHASRIDVLSILLVLLLLYKSKKYLKPELWVISLILCISPLVLKDTMSYSRYIIVAFPLAIYAASVIKGKTLIILGSVMYVLLIILSVYFVNWYWVA